MGNVRVHLRRLTVIGSFLAMALPAGAATFAVNSTADQVDAIPGDGACASAGNVCTLRAAVLEANALLGGDTIVLPAGTFRLTLAGSGEDLGQTGDLDVTDALEVTGAGVDASFVDGYGADRILDVLGASPLSLANLTLRRGYAAGTDGGAVRHVGPAPLTLTSVRFERNFAGAGAAVHHAGGDLTVSGCTFEDNLAGAGGAIFKTGPGVLAVSGSVFTANLASGGAGGAVHFDGPDGVTIADSRFVSNSGGTGGALSVAAANGLTLTGSRFEDSHADGNGGAVAYSGPGGVAVSGTTFTGGLAGGSGGGLLVEADGNLDVSGSTFTDNAASYTGGGLYYNSTDGGLTLRDGTLTSNAAFGGSGGGFYASAGGPLVLANLEVRGNSSDGGGGGGLVSGHATATISALRVLDNTTAGNAGGGLYENAGGTTTIADSAFSGNQVGDGDGGGLYRVGGGAPDIQRTLFAANAAGGADAQGGGLFVASGEECLLLNVTFSGNYSAYRGGGLFAGGAVRVRSATFAGDNAAEGGAIYSGSEVKVANTILASAGGGNCAGNPITSGNGNLDTGGACALDGTADQAGVDPQLAPLADNGGPTATHALAVTSPAVDKGNSAICPATDQRGVPRPADGNEDGQTGCDIGAFEYLDQCPGDPRKFVPGACGCGQPDADDNGNGAVDCLVNAEIKARIARARVLLGQMVEAKTQEQRAFRSELKGLASGLVAYVARHRKEVAVTDPHLKPAKLVRKVGQALKGAVRARGGKLERARQKATTALDALDRAVAAQ